MQAGAGTPANLPGPPAKNSPVGICRRLRLYDGPKTISLLNLLGSSRQTCEARANLRITCCTPAPLPLDLFFLRLPQRRRGPSLPGTLLQSRPCPWSTAFNATATGSEPPLPGVGEREHTEVEEGDGAVGIRYVGDRVVPRWRRRLHLCLGATTPSLNKYPSDYMSTREKIINDHRTRLSGNTLEALICFQNWLRKAGSSYLEIIKIGSLGANIEEAEAEALKDKVFNLQGFGSGCASVGLQHAISSVVLEL